MVCRIPPALQLPKWELSWECEGSFPHTLRNMKCDSWASLLASTLASPCFGHEPKAKVATLDGRANRGTTFYSQPLYKVEGHHGVHLL